MKTARPDFGLDPLDFIELLPQIEQQFRIWLISLVASRKA
jgi:hypothetical protein